MAKGGEGAKKRVFHRGSPGEGVRMTAELSNKRADLGFVTARRQIRYARVGRVLSGGLFVERRRILNCLPHNVALRGSSSLARRREYWQPVNILCGTTRQRTGIDRPR